MPEEHFGEEHEFLRRSDLLSFEEIALVARAAAALSVKKLRLTGGEPLLRRDLPSLVEMLRAIPGIEDIALTTNGLLLPQLAQPLKDAGVDRITVSLDSLDDATLARISGRPITSAQVLAGIDAAGAAGFTSLKVNAVIQRGVNDDQVLPLAEHFRGTDVILRFIEFMDVGTLNQWNLAAVVPAAELRDAIAKRHPLEPAAANYTGEVAARYRYTGGQGEIGFITSVTQPFCRDCSRLRLAPDGALYTCLFASQGHPLKHMLRAGATLEALTEHLRAIWTARSDRYSEVRTESTAKANKVEMYHIGG
jgi:cyclic pyranopterin phosphate synthase